jgi:GDSL-like lipase/acylhydrolase family protein
MRDRILLLSYHLTQGVPRRRKYILRRLVVGLVIGFTIITTLAEAGLRFYFTNYGTENQKRLYIYSPQENQVASGLFFSLPYVGYGLNPNHPGHNSLGYRGPEITVPKPNGTFRIVAIGSSVTYGNLLGDDETYPAQLQAILRDQYGYQHVEVINAGVGGYSSAEYLTAFQYRILDLQPDMIIVYESTNDVLLRLVDPQYYTATNPMRTWRDASTDRPPSVLLRFLAVKLGWIADPRQPEEGVYYDPNIRNCVRDVTYCASLNMTKHDLLQINKPIYYERNIRSLIGMAQAQHVQTVLISWAYFPDPLPSNETQYMTQPERQEAVAEQNVILRRLSQETGAPFYDMEANLPYNAAFWIDGRHMTAVGAHEFSSELANFLVTDDLLSGK